MTSSKNTNMERSDSDGLCRICLTHRKPMTSIFDFHDSVQYSHKIVHCARIQISEHEDLPLFICEQCKSDLAISYDFVIKCQSSDESLRKSYQLQKLDKAEVVSIKYENDSDNAEIGNDMLQEDLNPDITIKEEPLMTSKIEYVVIKPEQETPKIQKTLKRKRNSKKEPFAVKADKRQSAPSKKDVTCRICGLRTNSLSALINHTRKHTGEKPFVCAVCGVSFAQKGTLKGHLQSKHSVDQKKTKREFNCDECGKIFIRKRDMVIHIRVHTGETPHACQYCPKRFSQLSSLIRHRRTHTGEKPFSCPICKKSFIDNSLLKSHSLVHSEERRFTCNLCGKSVKTKKSLIGHIECQHMDANPFVCDQCGAVFKSRGGLLYHSKKYHSEKSGNCSICSRTVADITSHMRRHTGEDTVRCKICNKKFTHSRSLIVHMMIHNNADKFTCNEKGCGKKFFSKHMFEFHIMKYHSHEVPYHCKLCKKGCLRKSDLKRHMQFYHNKPKD